MWANSIPGFADVICAVGLSSHFICYLQSRPQVQVNQIGSNGSVINPTTNGGPLEQNFTAAVLVTAPEPDFFPKRLHFSEVVQFLVIHHPHPPYSAYGAPRKH